MTYPDAQIRRTILALALGAFAIGVSEFATMGLLPYYARDLGISEPVAGHAISGYAFGVVIGAPVLAVLGARLPRKLFLVLLIAFFALANAVAALAPTANLLIGSRFLSGLPHGAYLGIAMLFAADILPKGKRAQGVAKVLMGLTIANVIGVPAAGAIGQSFGWRWCFVIVTAIAAASALLIKRVAPVEPADPSASPLRELGVLRSRAMWLTLMVGSVGFGGVFAVYSFFSAAMIDAAAAPSWAIPLALSGFGLGPRGESTENLAFMAAIDRQFLATPWYGSRQMARHMQRERHKCGRHRVRRLMKLMRLVPIRGPAGHCAAMSREGTRNRRPAGSTLRTRYTRIF